MELLYPLALLVCPVGMGMMMWLMMRGGRGDDTEASSREQEIASLRTEVEALRDQHQREHQM